MRIARRLLAAAMCALAALAMCVGLAGTAWGEDGTGSITIKNAVEGQTYNVYRIFDLESYNATEGSEAYSYKVADKWQDFFDENSAGTNGRQWVDIDKQGYVTWKTGENAQSAENVQAFAKAALAWAKGNSIKVDADAQTASGTTVTFNDLDLGYYLVDSSLGALCALDTTNPAATVNDKNDAKISVEKKIVSGTELVGENDANFGDTVQYQVTVKGKNLGAQEFTLHDVIDSGLELVKTDGATVPAVVVKLDGKELSSETDYTVTVPETDEGCSFHVTLKGTAGPSVDANGSEDSATQTITVTYAAKVLNTAKVYGTDESDADAANVNKAWATYGDSDSVKTTESSVKTYVWRMGIFKYTGTDTALTGAKFILKDADGNYLKFNKDETAVAWKFDGTSTTEDNATVMESPADGKINILGLKSGKYTIVETQAPAGYNKLASDVVASITYDATKSPKVLGVVSTGENEKATVYDDGYVRIQNNTGTELPSTGGMGTTVIYVAGGLLVAAAVVLLVAKKKMSADDK